MKPQNGAQFAANVGSIENVESLFKGTQPQRKPMKISFGLLLALVCAAPLTIARADESCGPKSGLCWPKVARGASGPRVVALQYLLRSRGFKVVADGKFAFATESAVRRFQAKNKLQVDGRIGWQSWDALTPNLKRGARGDAVRALQTLLNFQGRRMKIDGVFGSATQKAVVRLQKPIALIGEDGKVDDGEWCYASGGHLDGE